MSSGPSYLRRLQTRPVSHHHHHLSFIRLSSSLFFPSIFVLIVLLFVRQLVHLVVEKLLYFFLNWGKEACAFCKNRIIKFVLCFLQLLLFMCAYFSFSIVNLLT